MKKLFSLISAAALLFSSVHVDAAYIPPAGTNGQLQYNNNGKMGGLSYVPVANGGTNASTPGAALDNLTGATGTGAQLLNKTGTGAWSSQKASSVLGSCYLTDYDPLFFTKGQTAQGTSLQNFLLDCQKKAIAAGAATFSSLHKSACMTAVTTSAPFGINLSTPIVIPRYVCFDPTASSFVRDGSTGTPTANWTGDTTTAQLSNLNQPIFLFPPTGLLTGELVVNLNRVGSDRGSGVFYGRTWRVRTMSIATGGSGFVGGESCSMANGDPYTPSTKATFTCAAASGGACTAITYAPNRWDGQTGQYLLPPFLQAQQWAISNGWDGTDVLRPQVFDVSGNYRTSCSGSGTGLAVTPTWWPDWCDGTNGCALSTIYDGAFGNFYPATGYLKSIVAVQSQNLNSASYGPTYGVWIAGFDVDIDFIQTGFARFGTILYGADIRAGTINDVGSWGGLKIASGGSIHVKKYVGDSPIDHYLALDKVGNVSLNGSFLNTSSSITGAAAVLLGADSAFSNASNQNRNVKLTLNMENGGSTAGIPAISCAYTRNSEINATVSNLSISGAANAYQNNKFVSYGSNCEASNMFTGSIDNVAGSLFSGSDLGVGINIWDGYAKAWAGSFGTYNIVGSGAPVSGGSGTGLNKAGPGSIYRDIATGSFYTNTTASSSPTWGAVGGTSTQSRVFQLSGTTLAVGNDLTNWVIMPAAGTITGARAIAKTGPTGQALIFDIKKSTNNGSTFTSIWNSTPANRIQIAAGAVSGTQTSFDTTTFNAGDIFRIDIIQVGSGAAGGNATVNLTVTQ